MKAIICTRAMFALALALPLAAVANDAEERHRIKYGRSYPATEAREADEKIRSAKTAKPAKPEPQKTAQRR